MKILISESQFKKMISLLNESTDNKLSVLFAGDSLSAGPGYTWNYVLEKKHKNDWDVDHAVKGGIRTDKIRDKVLSKLSNKHYDIVFVYGGTNDMFSEVSSSTAKNNLKEIINAVANQGGKTYIYSGYDVESSMPTKLVPTKYCDTICMPKKRQRMIDFQKTLGELNGPNSVVIPPTDIGVSSFSKRDSTHPSGAAHIKMADAVDSFISGNIPPPKESSYLESLIGAKKGSGSQNMFSNLLSDLKEFNGEIEYKGTVISDDIVFQIQTALQLLGYSLPVWGIDGKFGPETKRAVKSFQNDLNLDEDGIVNSNLIGKLIDKLKISNITDSDFQELNIEKQSSLSDEEPSTSSSSDFDFKGVISSSIIDKFKKVLEKNELSYDEFVRKLPNGLSPEIAIAQLHAESAFSPDIINCSRTSSAGAKGIAQFMPSTWTGEGYKGSPCIVKDALDAYAIFMGKLIKMFPNRIDLSVAGYNSGPYLSIYKKALNNNLSFNEIKNKLPAETRGYVKKILGLG